MEISHAGNKQEQHREYTYTSLGKDASRFNVQESQDFVPNNCSTGVLKARKVGIMSLYLQHKLNNSSRKDTQCPEKIRIRSNFLCLEKQQFTKKWEIFVSKTSLAMNATKQPENQHINRCRTVNSINKHGGSLWSLS